MSDRIVAHKVIRMTLANFPANDTQLKKNLEFPYLEIYSEKSGKKAKTLDLLLPM